VGDPGAAVAESSAAVSESSAAVSESSAAVSWCGAGPPAVASLAGDWEVTRWCSDIAMSLWSDFKRT